MDLKRRTISSETSEILAPNPPWVVRQIIIFLSYVTYQQKEDKLRTRSKIVEVFLIRHLHRHLNHHQHHQHQ